MQHINETVDEALPLEILSLHMYTIKSSICTHTQNLYCRHPHFFPHKKKQEKEKSETNCRPLLLTIYLGILNLANKTYRTLMVVLEVMVLMRIPYSHLLCAATSTKNIKFWNGLT